MQGDIAQGVQHMDLGRSAARNAHARGREALQENVHACMADNVRNVMMGYDATDPGRHGNRLRPENMPVAGVHAPRRHEGAPYGQYPLPKAPVATESAAAQQNAGVWTHSYARPQYARKRCPDLAITAPGMRDGALAATGRAPQARGVYAYEGSVTSTTTYMSPTVRR